MARLLSIQIERFPLAEAFVISRGARTESIVLVATIEDQGRRGRGECVPYSRYGESVESVAAQIETARGAVEAGADRLALQGLLPPGAARNALDCALWDLDAKLTGLPAYQLAGLDRLQPAVTAYTISVGEPAAMARVAAREAARPLLKLKLAGENDVARLRAVREAAPSSALIADANEACSEDQLEALLAACAKTGVALLEQPLPAGSDAALARIERLVPVCADESVHDRRGLAELRDRYDAINIKLDKTGGLTEALALAEEAQRLGFAILVGCMVGSSLAMAPAMLLSPRARFVDLDGPLLLAKDRADGLRYEGSIIHPSAPQLWG
ncbi:MAG TPA: N-acetyl-D-Glu racemase DgcA [Beijerinckiaceae bacterium]|nr:N-acetyl-D-Glu racemase DgcA [Beijerinckiaceae bacterium]